MTVSTKRESSEWKLYEELMRERPDEFRQNPMLEIVTDLEEICGFEEATQKTIGVVYKSPFNMMVVDLVKAQGGKMFAYERVLPTIVRGAVVSVPVYNDKYVLLRQYRHALRDFQYAFPRGYGERSLTPEENVKKELSEELGAVTSQVRFLGFVVADSGLTGSKVAVYRCNLSAIDLQVGHEGIESAVLLTNEDMRDWISQGKLNDGFTLAAYGMCTQQKEN